jgi:glycosyl hydrolase family 42 (putative beta-galactosidase)
MKYFFLCITTMLCISASWAGDTRLDKDGMLMVDGERRFVLGLYQTADNDAFAEEVAGAGFNLIRAKANATSLDRAQKAGLQCWIPIGNWAVENQNQSDKLSELINKYKSHPALAVWEGPDEILWNIWWRRYNRAQERWKNVNNAFSNFQGSDEEQSKLKELKILWERYRSSGRYALTEDIEEKMRLTLGMKSASEKLSEWHTHIPALMKKLNQGSKIIKDNDPEHVIWFNYAPRNTLEDLNKFDSVTDIVGCDIYPVPFGPDNGHSDIRDRRISCVGSYTHRMAASAPGKPVWMVLQGFGWDDLLDYKPEKSRPRPTFKQTRFMAYDAIVNGAQGILYWGTFAPEPNSELWSDIKKVVSELDGLQRFLSAKDANDGITIKEYPRYGSAEKGIVLLAKESKGDYAFIVINEADEPIVFDICGLKSINGRSVKILNEPEVLTVKNGCLKYGLPGRSVSVLLSR